MENIAELKALLAVPKDIVVLSHRNPDGDAIGSSLALYHYLVQQGHTVKVIVPSEYPDSLSWMPAVGEIIIYDLDEEATRKAVAEANMIFCTDFNALDRIDKVGDMVAARRHTPIVLIDHHLFPEPFADFVLSDTTASSASELVFEFIHLMGHSSLMNLKVSECIYTGILTDTGSFRYSTSPKLFRIVAQLLERGVDDYLLQDLIFNSMTAKQLQLLGHCLANRMEILEEHSTGIIALTKADYSDFDIQRGDTEGIVNYLLRVKKVKMAAFITEQPTIVKLSLRSKGDFDVQQICQKHFKGGGHKNASGGFSFQGLTRTLERFKALLPEYTDKLNG